MAKMKPKELSQDEQVDSDVRASYTDTRTAADRRRSTAGSLQKIGKLFLTWDSDPAFKRSKRRSANALKQLVAVPLSSENVNWQFEASLRDAIRSALAEEAEFDSDRPENGDGMAAGYLKEPSADFQTNQEVRAIILAAARTDASEEDVKRVTNALKNLGED
jgi:hypothetical protein